MSQPTEPPGKFSNYGWIIGFLTLSFLFNILLLLLSYGGCDWVDLNNCFSDIEINLIRCYIFGMVGATISSSVFLARDKEQNETESLKEKPDPQQLRYPDRFDLWLYMHRIVSSGFLGLISGLIILGGYSYVSIDIEQMNLRHNIILVLGSFIVGLNQAKFLGYLENMINSIYKKSQ